MSNTNANGANFDPYLTWLGIRDPQRPPNHYRLLGVELFEGDADVIAAAADRQMTYVRTYQAGQHGDHSQRILNELTTAKLCLLKPERKREYDERLRGAQRPAPQQPLMGTAPQARPYGAPPMQGQPMHPGAAARPPMARPMPQAAPAAIYEDDAPSPYGSPNVAVRSAVRPARDNSVMQWSIVGGLVLATVILAVVLASKYSGEPETTPVAQNPAPAKVTPTSTKTPATNPNNNPVNNPSPAETTPENTEPKNTEPKNTEPKNTEPKTTPVKAPKNPDEVRPGPVKNTLPNIPLPGIEEPSTPMPMPATPMNPTPMNPAPAVTPTNPATPAPATVATNNDPLNSLPTTTGNNPTEPMPANPLNPPANPLNPLSEPPNPLAMPMPNPLDGNPLNPATPKPSPRRPLPTAKEIAESRANIREVYKKDYALREPTALAAFGKNLLKTAQDSADKPAMMYTAYEESRNVSAQVNDLENIFTVHEELTREFAVDRDKDLLETIKVVAKAAPTMSAANAGSVLDLIYETASTAILEQHLDFAEQLLKYVGNFSGRVTDKATREIAFRELLKKLGEHKAFAAKAKEYKDALAKNPNDGEANLELGKFWAFQQGNFEQGLNFLVKGSDSEIREAAKRELSMKPDAPDYVKVAEAWWEVANKLPADPRGTVKVHAAYAYARALPNLKALDRGLAESRINEAYKSFKPNNREVKELIKLLLTRTNWKMEWKGRGVPSDPTVGFEMSGTCTADEYRSWKLMDNYIVVCFRDNDRWGPPAFGGFGFGRGRGNNNNNGNNNNGNGNNANARTQDPTKNVMQIAVTANRIDVRVLGNDGELRGTGTGIPD